jgi:diguanylate cyclase (GGDEF)-like protein
MAELSRQALRDPLTGLRNRRGLVDKLQAATRRAGQALVLLDLDGFKAVNDRFGHARGDELLCEVADRIRQASREGDLVFRLGGDEFAVLVGDVPQPRQALELGRRFVAAATIDDGEAGDLRVGASAGVRLLTSDSLGTAVHDADAALYAAKHSGRGQAALWHPALPAHPLAEPDGDRRVRTRQAPGEASSRT